MKEEIVQTSLAPLPASQAAAAVPEERQSLWDAGDLRTWGIIGLLFLSTLLIALLAYIMPQGRVAVQPTIHIY